MAGISSVPAGTISADWSLCLLSKIIDNPKQYSRESLNELRKKQAIVRSNKKHQVEEKSDAELVAEMRQRGSLAESSQH